MLELGVKPKLCDWKQLIRHIVGGTGFTKITGNKSCEEIQQNVIHCMQPSNPRDSGLASMAASEEQQISKFGIRSRKLRGLRSKLAKDHQTVYL